MASTNKTNYANLNQWVKTDPVLMEDFNEDNKKIDASLQALANALGSGMAEIKNNSAKTAAGSYTGTGDYGAGNPNTLTFDFEPKFIMISDGWEYSAFFVQGVNGTVISGGYTDTEINPRRLTIPTTWTGKTISWYSTLKASCQLNNQTEYHYFAIG